MCCEPSGYSKEEINGVCPDYGEPTVDGEAYVHCCWSPVLCTTCGYAPCDDSC